MAAAVGGRRLEMRTTVDATRGSGDAQLVTTAHLRSRVLARAQVCTDAALMQSLRAD